MKNTYFVDGLSETSVIILGVLSLALLAWTIAAYIVRSRTLFGIARRRGIKNYGLAWVPVACVWTLGSIADQYDGVCGIKRRWRRALLVMLVLCVAGYALMCVFGAMTILQTGVLNGARLPTEDMVGLLLPVCMFLLVFLGALGAYASCANICRYKLFESCKPGTALRLLLLTLLVPFAEPFCLRSCLKWDEGVKYEEPFVEVIGEPVYDGNGSDPWKYDSVKEGPWNEEASAF